MNTYYIFGPKLLSFRGSNVQAKLLTPLDWDTSVQWCHPPLNPMKIDFDFKFEVKVNFPAPNNYWTGAGVYLFDNRLLEMMRRFGVEFQEFDANLTCKRNSCLEERGYKVFRPIYTFPLIDREKSVYTEDMRFEKIIFDEKVKEIHHFLVDLSFPHIHFVSQEFRRKIEDNGITGCEFLSLEEYARQTTWR